MLYRKISSVLGLACLVVSMFTSGAWAGGVSVKIGELLANPKSHTQLYVRVEGIVCEARVTGRIFDPRSNIEFCWQGFKVADETGRIDVEARYLSCGEILADGDRVTIDATFMDSTSIHYDPIDPAFKPPFRGRSYLIIQSISKTSP